jgi:UDP-N-acetylglucosamine 1-carboxyvinyltransferase
MDPILIRGGRPLRGSLAISGSKNAALPIMAATLAVDGLVTLSRVPQLTDVATLLELLNGLGVRTRRAIDGRTTLEVTSTADSLAPYELLHRMRAGICVLGPLLARRGQAVVALPGGCNLGPRPIDLHLKGLAALGAELRLEQGYITARARRLAGAVIDLTGPTGSTVTGTCNVMTAATLARGTTVLLGAACEPEVVDLGRFLNRCGAKITGLGTSTLEIDGVDELSGCEHAVIPDRIEAATWLIAGAITRGELSLGGVDPSHLTAVIDTLRDIGVTIEPQGDGLVVSGMGPWKPCRIVADPYPGLPTDVQPQLTSLLALVPCESRVRDRVFPERYLHLPELCRLGADIRRDAEGCRIHGVTRLSGADVAAADLRGGAALLLATLAAEGDSRLHGVSHLDRGYENFVTKLTAGGARITRLDQADSSPLHEPSPTHIGPPPPKFPRLAAKQTDRISE